MKHLIPEWKLRNREPKTRQIMLRASESQAQLLQRAAEDQETSQQKVLEGIVWPVLEERYGPAAEDPQVARERIMAETKAAYLDAVAELFRLLELPASLKSPDHRELLMAANDTCGTARTAMLAAWEGEENEQWQR